MGGGGGGSVSRAQGLGAVFASHSGGNESLIGESLIGVGGGVRWVGMEEGGDIALLGQLVPTAMSFLWPACRPRSFVVEIRQAGVMGSIMV